MTTFEQGWLAKFHGVRVTNDKAGEAEAGLKGDLQLIQSICYNTLSSEGYLMKRSSSFFSPPPHPSGMSSFPAPTAHIEASAMILCPHVLEYVEAL